ncbi:ricin-type beta-trefoil lectin domain protein [Actinoplanes sp. NPDC023714]|uniref:ricin-type beta-trefoil lectin domain protein n=1 Tax=Actinoplanes sp. NPDC023714 TaxID=3154322 RepID=UPI00340017E6
MPRIPRWFPVAALVAAVLVLHPGPAAAESNGGTRVMPLGDSITEGTQIPGGYRTGLWQRAAAAGYRTDFVGSQFNGPAALGDHDHEGHPGWRIDQIDANVAGWLRTTTPRTVLLHIGTNDILQNHNVSGAPGRLSALLDRIKAGAPSADVFVATLIPLANPGQEAAARTFNAALPGIVSSKGSRFHLVDMHAALTTADLIDGVHPTAGGYDRMAATWYAALRAVPGSLGDPAPSTGQALAGAASGRCLDLPAGATANGTQPIIWDCSGAANQRWTYDGQTLRALGKCLDSPTGATTGARAQIWDCSGADNQRWTYTSGGTIRNARSGLCLEAGGTANGTTTTLRTCTTTANQIWTSR